MGLDILFLLYVCIYFLGKVKEREEMGFWNNEGEEQQLVRKRLQ